jgi:recombination protein RecT
MSAQLQNAPPRKFSMAIQGDGYKKLIANTLSDPKRSERFIAAVSSAVATNPALQECDAGTILSSALLGESLQLAHSPQLGHYYMVPYEDRKNNRKVAQFQLGYKGYVQLATRSGFYKKLNVLAIKAGELVSFNPLEEEIEINLIEDEAEREAAETVGYYAMFEYMNGFRKAMYWSYAKMLSHADKYSKAFNKEMYKKLIAGEIPEKEQWKYSSFWYKSFDDMAYKTMLRNLISRWGVMSVEMTEAYSKDHSTINEDGTYSYIDNADSATVVNDEPEQAPSLPELSDEDFKAKQQPWYDAITSGKKTSTQIITMLKSKYTLTEEQENTINDWSEQ